MSQDKTELIRNCLGMNLAWIGIEETLSVSFLIIVLRETCFSLWTQDWDGFINDIYWPLRQYFHITLRVHMTVHSYWQILRVGKKTLYVVLPLRSLEWPKYFWQKSAFDRSVPTIGLKGLILNLGIYFISGSCRTSMGVND